MKWFIDLRTRTKLFISFMFMAVLIGTVGIMGITFMSTLSQNTNRMYSNGMVHNSQLDKMQMSLLNARAELITIANSNSMVEINISVDNLKKLASDNDQLFKEYSKNSSSAQEQKLLEDAKQTIDNYRVHRDSLIQAAQAGNIAEAKSILPQAAEERNNAQSILSDISDLNSQNALAMVNTAESGYRISWIIMLILIITGFVLAIFFSFLIGGIIGKGLAAASKKALIMAEGNLSEDVPDAFLKRKDEIGDLAGAFKQIMDNLRNLLKEVMNTAEEMNACSQELSASAEETTAQSETINSSVQEIAAGMEETSASTEEVLASGHEIAGGAVQLSKKAEEGYQVVLGIEKRAEEVKNKAQNSQEQARTIYEQRQAGIIKAIKDGEVVQEIDVMANTISEIADQTNLLALNAAIEAARAGEQGRGFAVVAEEVRKLAEQSATTVSGIQVLINKVREAFQELTDNSQEILRFIDEKVTPDYEMLVETGVRYAGDAATVGKIVQDFASTSQQMSTSIGQINQAIEAVATAVEQATSNSQEIATNIEGTSQAMAQVATVAETSTELAQRLNDLVHKFKIQ